MVKNYPFGCFCRVTSSNKVLRFLNTTAKFPWVVVLLFFFCSLGTYGQETIRDEFEAVSYSNNDGTKSWNGDWVENGDDDNSKPNKGNIRIYKERLRFKNNFDERSISRKLDFSDASAVVLTLDYETADLEDGMSLLIQLWNSATNSWEIIKTLMGKNTVDQVTYSLTSGQMSGSSEIRFLTKEDDKKDKGEVFIDNIEFSYVLKPKTVITNRRITHRVKKG